MRSWYTEYTSTVNQSQNEDRASAHQAATVQQQQQLADMLAQHAGGAQQGQ